MSGSPGGQHPVQRGLAALVGRPWFWGVLVATLFGLPLVRSILRKLPSEAPVVGELPRFTTRWAAGPRAGKPFDAAQLAGRIWVATFIDPTDASCDRLG